MKEIPKIEGKHRCVMCDAPFDEDFVLRNNSYIQTRTYGIHTNLVRTHLCESCYALFSESGLVYAYQRDIIIPLEFV